MLPSVARHRVALLGQQCKHRVCTLFPTVFPSRSSSPLPFPPLSIFRGYEAWVFAAGIGAAAARLGHLPFIVLFSEQQFLGGCNLIGRFAWLGCGCDALGSSPVYCALLRAAVPLAAVRGGGGFAWLGCGVSVF